MAAGLSRAREFYRAERDQLEPRRGFALTARMAAPSMPDAPIARAAVRRRQHLGARGDHAAGAGRPSRRDLRSVAALPRPVLALRARISPLPGARRRSGGLSGFRRGSAGAATVSTCCCRSTSRGWCSPRCSIASRRTPGWRCRLSPATARRSTRPASARCWIELGLPQPPTRIVDARARTARTASLSVRDQGGDRHREPRGLDRAIGSRTRRRAARTAPIIAPPGAPSCCRILSRARSNTPRRCSAVANCWRCTPIAGSPRAPAADRRDQAERAARRRARRCRRDSAGIWPGTARCRWTTSGATTRRATSTAIRGWSSR